jgi:hypothetical protein
MPSGHIENPDWLLTGGCLGQCAAAAAAASVELLHLYAFRFDSPASFPSKVLLCKHLERRGTMLETVTEERVRSPHS